MPLVRKPKGPESASKPAVASESLAGLASTDPDKRWAAARAASTVAGGTQALANALQTETDARVREAILTGLARIGTSDSANQLLPLLRSDDAQLRTGALDALRMMPQALSELLPALLQDRDSDVRLLSCELARGLSSETATTLLCGLLAGEQQVNVCAAAIEVMAEVGNVSALPVLAECGRRFPDAPFLGFAIRIATARIKSQSARG
jgi:HEAT repeat protein